MPAADYPGIINDMGVEFLDDLPPFLRKDPTIQAAMHAISKKLAEVEDAIAAVIRNLIPETADELGLPWWETLAQIAANPVGLTVEQRVDRVVAAIARLLGIQAGSQWEAWLSDQYSGATYREYDPDDDTGPPPDTLRVLVPFGIADPSVVEHAVRQVVAAHLDIESDFSEGFKVDDSELDQETFEP